MANIAIIVGHPRTKTLCSALAEHYQKGAVGAGHHVDRFHLAEMTFDPTLWEGFEAVQPLEPDLQAANRALKSADHIVIIFPLWLGDIPALLKGFMERVFQPEMVEFSKAGKYEKLFAGKSAHIVVTMGMPASIYRFWFGAYAVKILKRNVFGFLGIKTVRTTLLGSVMKSASRRESWLKRCHSMGSSAL